MRKAVNFYHFDELVFQNRYFICEEGIISKNKRVVKRTLRNMYLFPI